MTAEKTRSKWLDDMIKGFYENLTLCCFPCIVIKHCLCCDKDEIGADLGCSK